MRTYLRVIPCLAISFCVLVSLLVVTAPLTVILRMQMHSLDLLQAQVAELNAKSVSTKQRVKENSEAMAVVRHVLQHLSI